MREIQRKALNSRAAKSLSRTRGISESQEGKSAQKRAPRGEEEDADSIFSSE